MTQNDHPRPFFRPLTHGTYGTPNTKSQKKWFIRSNPQNNHITNEQMNMQKQVKILHLWSPFGFKLVSTKMHIFWQNGIIFHHISPTFPISPEIFGHPFPEASATFWGEVPRVFGRYNWTRWVFPKIMVPQIIHFNRVFHHFHHPFWGTTIFGNTQIFPENLIPNRTSSCGNLVIRSKPWQFSAG